MKNNSNSKNDILQSALSLFSEKGYDAVSVNEIVEKAGVTKPVLYYFFNSKEGVFKAILDEKYSELIKVLGTKAKYEPNVNEYFEDVYPVLLNIVGMYFNFAKNNKEFYLMTLSLLFAPPTAQASVLVKSYNEQHYNVLIDLFYDISKVHKNLSGKEKELATSFLAVINSNIAFWYQGYDEINEKKAIRIVHQFMHGVFA